MNALHFLVRLSKIVHRAAFINFRMFRIRLVKRRDIFKSATLSESTVSKYAPLSAVTPLRAFPCTSMVVTENFMILMIHRAIQIKSNVRFWQRHNRKTSMRSVDPMNQCKTYSLACDYCCTACLSYAPQETVKGREIWWHRKRGSRNKKSRKYEGLVFARGESKRESSFVRTDTENNRATLTH